MSQNWEYACVTFVFQQILATCITLGASQLLGNAANTLLEMGKNGDMERLELSLHPETETSVFKRWLYVCQY